MLDNGSQMFTALSRCADPARSPLWESQPRITTVLSCGPESNNVSYGSPHRPVLAMLLRLIFLASFLSSFALADAPLEVGWRNGRLSVNAKDVQFSQVLREIARQTGTEMQGLEMLHGRVSVHFSGAGLAESFQNLLSGHGYALINKTSQGDGNPHLLLVVLEERVPHQEEAAKMNTNNPSPVPRSGPPLEETPRPAAPVEAQKLPGPFASPLLNPSARASVPLSQKLAAFNASIGQGDQEALREVLLDSDPMVQASAFQALAGQDKEAATEALLSAVGSDQPSTRLKALQFLDQSGYADQQTVLPVLADALKDGDVMVRGYALQALATRGGEESISYLRQALGDPEPSFRTMVISSVAGKDEMRPLLREALLDRDESVSRLADFLLQQTGTDERQQDLRGGANGLPQTGPTPQ